jgi:uncharacterized damage-inducible protein DinB
MSASLHELFLDYSIRKLDQHTSRIVDCLGRLSDEQVWARKHPTQNAVGNLVLHLCGNVRQWIGYGVAGLPDIRHRQQEFEATGPIRVDELKLRLQEAVQAATASLKGLSAEDLLRRTTIQHYDVTVLEAIYQVVEHFAQHTGQVIFAAKLLTGEDLGYYRHLNYAPEQAPRTP